MTFTCDPSTPVMYTVPSTSEAFPSKQRRGEPIPEKLSSDLHMLPYTQFTCIYGNTHTHTGTPACLHTHVHLHTHQTSKFYKREQNYAKTHAFIHIPSIPNIVIGSSLYDPKCVSNLPFKLKSH